MQHIFLSIVTCLSLWLGSRFGCYIAGLGRGGIEVLVRIILLFTILCGLTFPSVRITLAALLEGTSDYLYDSAKKEKTFIPYWLKKVRDD